MKIKISRKKRNINLVLISVILILNIGLASNNRNSFDNSLNSNGIRDHNNPRTSSTQYHNDIPWLENVDFNSPLINPWFNTTTGDSTDIIASNSSGQADILVVGDEGEKKITNVFADINKWTDFNKSELDTYPDNYGVDTNGVWCDRAYDEHTDQENQFPKIYWRYNVSMGMDMSDYEITSASFIAVFNESVDPNLNVDAPGDSVAHPGDPGPFSDELHDSVLFTVEISDMAVSEQNTYLIADNRTVNLGNDLTGYIETENTLTKKLEEDIKYYIGNVLDADPGHDNFTIILGIEITCADNSGAGDQDYFDECRIKSLSFNFTYRKKIDKFTALSWSQTGNAINYTSPQVAQVTNAIVNFDYKIDKNWTETTNYVAENSEFRVLINGNPSEDYPTIKLNRANETFQEAIAGGYDITNLIPLKENITLSIQVYLADDFILDQIINISIDNILFNISYTVRTVTGGAGTVIAGDGGGGKDVVKEEPWINLVIAIAAIAGAICLGSYLVAYQLYLKYPKPVRKIRKYRRTLKRKGSPGVEITSRDKLFNDKYKKHSNIVSNLPKGKVSGKIHPSTKTIGKIDKKPST